MGKPTIKVATELTPACHTLMLEAIERMGVSEDEFLRGAIALVVMQWVETEDVYRAKREELGMQPRRVPDQLN